MTSIATSPLPPVFPYPVKQGLNNGHYSIYMLDTSAASGVEARSSDGELIAVAIRHIPDPRTGNLIVLQIEMKETHYMIWGLGPFPSDTPEGSLVRCTTFYRTFPTLTAAFEEVHAVMTMINEISPLLDVSTDADTLTRAVFTDPFTREIVLRNPACPLEAHTAYFLSAASPDSATTAYLSFTPAQRAIFHYLVSEVIQNADSSTIADALYR